MTSQLCAVPADTDLKPIYGAGAPGIYEILTSVADRKAATRERRERFGEIAYQNVFGRKCVMPMSPETAEPNIACKSCNSRCRSRQLRQRGRARSTRS